MKRGTRDALEAWRGELVLVHSIAILLCCTLTPKLENTATASDPIVAAMCLCGIFIYIADSVALIVLGEGSSSMAVHHLIAVFIQALFWWHDQGLAYWQTFGWTELGAAMHKLARFVPRNFVFLRQYQALYLLTYLVTYAWVILYLISLPQYYATPSVLGIPSSALHFSGVFSLVSLLAYWMRDSASALVHVLRAMQFEWK